MRQPGLLPWRFHADFALCVVSYLTVYNVMLVLGIMFYCMSFLVYLFGALRASRKLHKTLVGSVLSATLRWLDKTPTSRIITRCTQDIQCSECVSCHASEYR